MKINRIEESNKKGCKVSIEKKQFADVLKSSINELSCLLNREKYGAISMQTWKNERGKDERGALNAESLMILMKVV